jgi:D-lactate dehydrogenase
MVVTDTSSCASELASAAAEAAAAGATCGAADNAWAQITVSDPATFAATILIPRLQARGRLRPGALDLLLHPTCSEHHQGWAPALASAVQHITTGAVRQPSAAGCCGMAGDKGWTLPALTAHATAREASQARASGAACGVTTSATCAGALSAACGLPYRHLFALLADALT